MFDTMTLTKVTGGLCGTLLVYLLGGWVAETIYHGGGGNGYEKVQAYVIPVEGGDAATEEVVEEVPFAEIYATAVAADGEGVYRNCRACHSLEDGDHGTGPSLYGVVGRGVGAVGDFGYSGALSEVAEVWDAETLNAFLADPKGFAPGTSMSYNGLRKVEDRANLIAYLDSLDD